MDEPRKIFVTGATGYIAKHTILQLLQAGHSVRASVRNLSSADDVKACMAHHTKNNKLEFVTLDLLRDDGWNAAMQGIDTLIHTASPVPITQPRDENKLIKPAVEGTLRALNAAHKADIKRVVMTSSVAAIMHRKPTANPAPINEQSWSNISLKTASAYVKSKTLAERAAWDFVNQSHVNIDLTTINPSVVFGAPLDDNIGASLSLIKAILKRKIPAIPNIGFVATDVVDVAKMHVAAIENKTSFGNRYIAVSQFIWLTDIANLLAKHFPQQRIITRHAPNWLMRFLAIFSADLRSITQDLGQKNLVSNHAAQQDLHMEFADIETTILDTANYMAERKLL